MSLDDRVSRLIGRIYAGIHDEGDWDATMRELVAVTGVRWALSSVTDIDARRHDRLGWHGPTEETGFATGMAEWERGETAPDPTLAWAARHPTARFCDSRQTLADAEYAAHPFIRWDKARFGTDHWLCGFTPPRDGLSFAMSIHPHEGPASDGQAQLFRLLFEHAQNAASIYIQPPWLLETRDPCFLLDRSGRVAWQNEAAERLLSGSPALGAPAGVLTARDPASQSLLERAVRHAGLQEHDRDAAEIVRIRRDEAAPLYAIVRRAPHRPGFLHSMAPAALVRVIDPMPAQDVGDDRAWRAAFGLTAAEARLARALIASDEGLKGAAKALDIAYATARVQLAQVFAKLGVRSQGQLIKLLLRL